MGTGVQCVLQRMHNMTAESASGALHSEREMCYRAPWLVNDNIGMSDRKKIAHESQK